MSFGISKTIPANQGIEALNKLYDGSISEFEFHMAGKPSKLSVGDYVYTIFKNQLHGRLKITRIESGARHPKSGKARTLIYVSTPGKRLAIPLEKKGHRGTRYYQDAGNDGASWNSKG